MHLPNHWTTTFIDQPLNPRFAYCHDRRRHTQASSVILKEGTSWPLWAMAQSDPFLRRMRSARDEEKPRPKTTSIPVVRLLLANMFFLDQ
jgi:hypothetical protein